VVVLCVCGAVHRLSEIVKQVTKADLPAKDAYLILTVCVSNEDGDEVDIPYVRYRYRF
jgi:hypothetical protein